MSTASIDLRVPEGFTRLVQATRAAEIGLLRAVAIDLVVAGGSGDAASDPVAARLFTLDLIRQLTGPAEISAQAYIAPGDAHWTFLGQSDLDVVVNAHVTHIHAEGPTEALRAVIRIAGSHGSARADLLRPELDVRTPGVNGRRHYATVPVIEALAQYASALDAPQLASVADALAVLTASSETGQSKSWRW